MVDKHATQKKLSEAETKNIICGLTDYCNQVNKRKIKYKFSHILPVTKDISKKN